MHAIVETAIFIRRANEIGFSENELDEIKNFLAANPQSGNIIMGTGGARKLRWPARGKGKRSGYRIITFFSGTDIPVFLLDIYHKNEKDDLTQAERNQVKKILRALVDVYRGKKNE